MLTRIYVLDGSDDMLIRSAELQDVERICTLYQEFFAYNANLQPTYYRNAFESGRYPKSVIGNDKSVIFVAIEHDSMIGFIHADEESTPPFDSFVPHKYASVVDLYVTPISRKRGVGTALIHAIKNWAKARDLDYLELFVLAESEDAIRLYKRECFATTSFNMRCPL